MPSPEPTADVLCRHCQNHAAPEDTFCGYCGRALNDETEGHEDALTSLKPVLLYYFITLLLLAVYKLTPAFPKGLDGMVLITIIDTSIVIAFWYHNRQEMRSLFRLSKVQPSVLALTLAGAVVASFAVSAIAYVINISIQDDTFYDTYHFNDTSNPFLWSVVFIAVMPAIFEEVAFRGFMFNNLSKVMGGKTAVYVTGIMFGLLHLQFISLLWLVPIGLAFAFLRNRYNTLWYGIAGHFTYNFCITVFEFQGWF